jgi:manganese transport protein
MSGQIVMEGYLRLRINPLMRRLITRLVAIIPAIIFILITGEKQIDRLLIFSQVILSIQLGFAIIPLIHFVSDKKTMKEFVIKKHVQIIAWLMAALLIALNSKMIFDEIADYFETGGTFGIKIIIIFGLLLFFGLMLYVLFFPLMKAKHANASIEMHPEAVPIPLINLPVYKKIAIALDFSDDDYKIISNAIGQAGDAKEFILVHVVETAAAKLHGKETADYETQKDQERMDLIIRQMKNLGYEAKGVLGFNETAKEIIRIVNAENADMLVIGAHGHTGFKDFIYGSTIDTVRHELKIPVFIVRL